VRDVAAVSDDIVVGDDTVVRCIVVTGAGDAFCAGADVADLAEMTGPSASGRIEFCPAVVVAVPVVVAVNGLCVGAGLRFVADADIVLAAESAWFSDPHVSLGQLGLPVALALAEKASATAVAQLFLSGRSHRLSSAAAHAAGIVSEVVADGVLAQRAAQVAAEVAAQSPAAVRQTVAALRRRHRLALGAQLDEAWAAVVAQRGHPEAIEGLAAALEHRPPTWDWPLSWGSDGTVP
jgi:enoyl-CoA hydratase/carnithine racemase